MTCKLKHDYKIKHTQKKYTTMSEQYQNPLDKSLKEAKSIS